MANIFKPGTWLQVFQDRPSEQAQQAEAKQSRSRPIDPCEVLDQRPEMVRDHHDIAPPQLPIRERIEKRAYAKWCAAGFPPGRDLEYWLEAEQEILESIDRGLAQ